MLDCCPPHPNARLRLTVTPLHKHSIVGRCESHRVDSYQPLTRLQPRVHGSWRVELCPHHSTCFLTETERVRRQPTITATNTHAHKCRWLH